MKAALRTIFEVMWRERGERHSHWWSAVVNGVMASAMIPNRVRTQLYRLAGLKLDRRVIVRSGAVFRSARVTVGAGSTIGYGALFDVRSDITIGRNVGIGSRTVFVDHEHAIDDPQRRAGPGFARSIIIGDGARVSTGTMVLPGVAIGAGAVVGARSLVTADVEPHALYVGVPARKVRDLPR